MSAAPLPPVTPSSGLPPSAPSSAPQDEGHACRWRFCTAVLPSAEALKAHVVAHVDEAHPSSSGASGGGGGGGGGRPGPEALQDGGERPEPHGEKSFPVLKEGAVLHPPAHDA
ncbi:hypothetical protein JCM10450v2_006532 [Rhodotorula kratochvilovae]